MGMINVPQENTPYTGEEILNPSTEEKNPDDVRYENPLDFGEFEDDLKVTNEAVKLLSIKRELGVDAMDMSKDSQIKEILAIAKESGIKNRNELLARIREIDYMLGNTDDKPKIEKIYQYMKIRNTIKGLSNKLEALRK